MTDKDPMILFIWCLLLLSGLFYMQNCRSEMIDCEFNFGVKISIDDSNMNTKVLKSHINDHIWYINLKDRWIKESNGKHSITYELKCED